MKGRRRKQAELRIKELPDSIMAVYSRKKDEIIVDAKKLTEHVEENVRSAREYHPSLEEDAVWVAKFASLISHEIIHRAIDMDMGKKVSLHFDRLYLMEFMGKLPPNSLSMLLWSDALETCPIGDTWFS